MKKTLEWLANTGRKVKNSIKRNAKMGLVGLTLFSPLLLAGKVNAKDIEGSLWIDYYIDSIGGHTCGLNFIEGAKDGWDSFDFAYTELPFPDDAHAKGVGSIDGREADGVSYPPLTDTIGSSGGTSFNGSLVVNSGRSVTLDNELHYLKCWTNGFEGCKVYVNGQDISTNSTVNLGTLTGTFGEGEHPTASWTVYVEYVGTNGGGTWDPNDPNGTEDPNQVVGKPAPGRLLIENVHTKLGTTGFNLVYVDGATEEPNDLMDVEYTRWTGIPPPFVVSNCKDKYLKDDARGTNSKTPVYLQQMFHSDVGFARLGAGDTNSLVFSFPENQGTNNESNLESNIEPFAGRVITFQEYDPNDPNVTHPVHLIREGIADGNGVYVINLPDLEGRIYTGTWHNFVVRTDANSVPLAIADFNRDNKVDPNDVSLLEGALGYAGTSVYDIVKLKDPLALPGTKDYGIVELGRGGDNIVNILDLNAANDLLIQDEKRRGVNEPNDLYE